MTRIIKHRGPDDEGYVLFKDFVSNPLIFGGSDTPNDCYTFNSRYHPDTVLDTESDPNVIAMLGHRRLSIIDVSSAAHQPMCTKDGRCWIVFNGEIYNYLELRKELEKTGYEFFTNSDTEVILLAYKHWGKECLVHFNGMFAILILDLDKKQLFAARDRFGVKPLYYWVSENFIAFASEIKQFSTLPGWRAKINGQRAYDFLNWSVIDHTEETLFSGVYQLRCGEALKIPMQRKENLVENYKPHEKLPAYKWYQLTEKPFCGSLGFAGEQFRNLLKESVQLRMRADVPVGSCLSGGLDSSSIVCLMNQLLNEQNSSFVQKTFSACTEEERYDEREFIEEILRYTNVDSHYVFPTIDDLFNLNEKITWHQDEPFVSSSIYAQWEVFRLAAKNSVKVMLDGQGADEQLGGYRSFFAARFANLLTRGRLVTLWREIISSKRHHDFSAYYAVMLMSNMLLPQQLRKVSFYLTGKARFSPIWLNMNILNAKPIDPMHSIGALTNSVSSLSYSQLTASNLQMLLHWEDRDSMAHSIESRVPFLDYRLVEFVLGLPDHYKISGGITKKVLREGLTGILPEMVRTRMSKLGFATPEQVWVTQKCPEKFKGYLHEAIGATKGVLTKDAKAFTNDIIEGKKPYNYLPWRIISFATWMRIFNVQI